MPMHHDHDPTGGTSQTGASSWPATIMHAIGRLEGAMHALEATVLTSRQSHRDTVVDATMHLNRRIDDMHRHLSGRIGRIERKPGRNGSTRKLQITGLVIMGLLSAFGHLKAETVQGGEWGIVALAANV